MMRRIGSAMTVGVLAIGLLAAPRQAAAGDRSPVTSGLLSGLVGLGSGHYYAGDSMAPWFTLLDIGLGSGTVALASGDNGGAATVAYLGLVGVRIWEIVDGVQAANRYNKRHGAGFTAYSRPSFGFGFASSPLGDYRSDDQNSLWAAGGASRDLALGFSSSLSLRPEFSLNVAVESPGIGFSWSKGF